MSEWPHIRRHSHWNSSDVVMNDAPSSAEHSAKLCPPVARKGYIERLTGFNKKMNFNAAPQSMGFLDSNKLLYALEWSRSSSMSSTPA